MHPHHRRPTVAALAAAALAAVAILILPAAPATAHNSLRTASPAQDARLATAPSAVTLEFLEALKPAFTTIVLSDSGGRRVPAGEPVIVGAKATLPITGTLANGSYTVAYRVVSADGHPVQGSYTFAVADPAASAAPAATTSAASPAATTSAASPAATTSAASPAVAAARSSGGIGSTALVVAVGVLVAFAAGAVVLLRRRRGR